MPRIFLRFSVSGPNFEAITSSSLFETDVRLCAYSFRMAITLSNVVYSLPRIIPRFLANRKKSRRSAQAMVVDEFFVRLFLTFEPIASFEEIMLDVLLDKNLY
jgi:hypothetical protein